VTRPTSWTIGLSTHDFRVRIGGDPSPSLTLAAQPGARALLEPVAPACPIELALPGLRLRGDDFAVTAFHEGRDAAIATCVAGNVEARLVWRTGALEAVRLLIQLRATGSDTPIDGTLCLAILDHIHPGARGRTPAHDPGQGPLAPDGRPLARSRRYPLPHSWWSPDGGVAILARYAANTQEGARWQAILQTVPVRLRPEWLDACELVFMACAPGWQGVFAALRGQVRADLDLSEYARPDLAWYHSQWLQHFTFLYGREIFDHARGQLDVDRLLDDGRRFGGYDGVLLWPAYPRMGVDERGQWDFYDDLPGGRAGLRALTERARARGIRVFIPYLPWDAPPEARRGMAPIAAEELARVVADSGVDGVFLDTMKNVVSGFRQAIDRVRAGVVFCSEGQPDGDAIARITGSWDQGEHRHAGEVDLARFLFPEHPSFMVNRHAVGFHREAVIARALFNGTGLVVWQDVFGEILPYTDAQAASVRATVTILRRYAALFRGADALPLVPTARPDVYANAFVAGDGRAALTVYNGSDAAIDGDLVSWTHDPDQRWACVDEHGRMGATGDRARGEILPGHVAVFVSSPRHAGQSEG